MAGAFATPKEIAETVMDASGAAARCMALLSGKSGTGKELIARAIHSRSPRAAGPIIRVNCGAIPPELIDSELFGHERGAFTGALRDRSGRFEMAEGGTVFLDEVAELSNNMQVKLLLFLQEGQFERVGGEATATINVRVISATNQTLKEAVKEGRFRDDLFSARDRMGGFELEAWLVDEQVRPAPVNEVFLRRLDNPMVVPELARFNVELNDHPQHLWGSALSRFEASLGATWNQCRQAAAGMQTQLLMIGIIETAEQHYLVLLLARRAVARAAWTPPVQIVKSDFKRRPLDNRTVFGVIFFTTTPVMHSKE